LGRFQLPAGGGGAGWIFSLCGGIGVLYLYGNA